MIQEFLIIFMINYAGNIISHFTSIPIPGTIIGMLILLILLYFNILKLKSIRRVTDFLVLNMPIFFLPSVIDLLDSLYLLQGLMIKVIFIVIGTTIITMIVTAKTVDFMIKKFDPDYEKTCKKMNFKEVG